LSLLEQELTCWGMGSSLMRFCMACCIWKGRLPIYNAGRPRSAVLLIGAFVAADRSPC
jgi:hypothetical protein